MKKLGLALGGGGLKGLAHIGVLQILEENHVPINMISGTSAGSVIAALYASGVTAHQMEEIVMTVKGDDYLDYNYGGIIRYIWSLIKCKPQCNFDGLIKGKKLQDMIYKLTEGKHLHEVDIPLSIVACDIDTGEQVIFTNENWSWKDKRYRLIDQALLSEAVRASCAIPAIFTPLNYMNIQMVDGGVLDIVPVDVQKIMGAEYILAVDLGQDIYNYGVKGIHKILMRTLDILEYHTSYTDQQVWADMIIAPGVTVSGLADLQKAGELIGAGRRAMKSRLKELKSALAI